jgi:hypothetical protein
MCSSAGSWTGRSLTCIGRSGPHSSGSGELRHDRLAEIHEVHNPLGKHVVKVRSFPGGVPVPVQRAAACCLFVKAGRMVGTKGASGTFPY